MAWSSGSFNRVRGSASWTADYNNNTGIEPGLHDTNDQDLAIGINNCIAKDGQNSATANLDLGGNRLTNVGNAVNAQDTVTLAQAQAGIDTQGTTLATTATRFSNDTSGSSIALRKSRGATVGTNTIVQSGDGIGTIFFQGANGTGYTPTAAINSNVDGTPGASSDMPGRLGFFTTPDGSGSLTERMRINAGGKINFHSTTSTNTAGECYFSSVPATEPPNLTFAKTFSGNRNVLLNYHNGAYIGGVDMNNTATSFPTSSDYRLKENITPMADALNRINQLKPVRFNFITDPNNEIDGFLAHEVAKVVPNAVFGEKDGVNEDGTMFVQSLDHSKIIPLLAGAIQELSAKLEALEAQLLP